MGQRFSTYIDDNGHIIAEKVNLSIYDVHSKKKKQSYKRIMEANEETQRNKQELWVAAYNKHVEEISKRLKPHELGALLVLVVHLRMDSRGKVMFNTKKPMTLEHIAKLIGKKDRQTREIINALVREKAIIKVREGRNYVYFVNSDLHTMGEEIREGEKFTKIMQSATKQKLRLLKGGKFDGLTLEQVGLLYKIIPYFHWSKFWLVENPDEMDVDKVKPLNLRQLADKVGMSYAALKRNMNGLIRAGIVMKMSAYNRNVYTVNPKILYRIEHETIETKAYKKYVIESFKTAKKVELE